MCISACLADRETSAKGRFIDISVREVMASRLDYVLGQMVAGDMDVGTERHLCDLGGPAGIFPCKEGYVYLWMSAPYHWKAVGELLGHPEWMKEFPDNWLERGVTPERIALVKRHLSDWLQHEDKHDVSARAQKLDLTMVPVNSAADLPHNEQLAHRRFFANVDHPSFGAAQYPTVPYKMSATPTSIERPAPALGEGNGLIDASEGGSQ